jgi:hypothetical protein
MFRLSLAAGSALLLAACLVPADKAEESPDAGCVVQGPQAAKPNAAIGFAFPDTLHWEIFYADDSTLLFRRAQCPDPEPGPPLMSNTTGHISVQRLSVSYDTAFIRFRAGGREFNIHSYRKSDTLGYPVYQRTIENDGHSACSLAPSGVYCYAAGYAETFVFFKGHVLRVTSAGHVGTDPEIRPLFQAFAFRDTLAKTTDIGHLKYQRDNLTLAMKDSIPGHLYGEYATLEEQQRVRALVNPMQSIAECDTHPEIQFFLAPICKQRYRILHPVD